MQLMAKTGNLFHLLCVESRNLMEKEELGIAEKIGFVVEGSCG